MYSMTGSCSRAKPLVLEIQFFVSAIWLILIVVVIVIIIHIFIIIE